jgi:beta-mannosidase
MKILMYLADNYLYPNSFEDLVYASQLLQADAIKYGVEHFRRLRGYTMGSVYWQFNDCWPVASWSSVDSLGRYKALHYAAKKFYSPVAMGLFLEDNTLTVNVSNETMNDFNGKIKVCFSDTKFNVKREYNVDIEVDALSSKDVFDTCAKCENKYNEFIYAELYNEDGELIMRQTELYVPPKHFEWNKTDIAINITKEGNIATNALKADAFAKGVYIDFDDFDLKLSDNFVNIVNADGATVTAETERTAEELKNSIKIKTVYDIGR